MSTVHTLIGQAPIPRFPEPPATEPEPWTQARVEYATVRSGPYTQVALQDLDPLDDYPEAPALRDITVEIPQTSGWLRVVFLDADGDEDPNEPVFVGSAIRPTVAEVANLMPDRTTLEGGTEAGTFTTETRPTAAQVDALIDIVLDSVDPHVPAGASTEAQRAARSITTVRAAMLTEATYYSSQGEVSDARIAIWEKLLEQQSLAGLDDSVDDSTGMAQDIRTPLPEPCFRTVAEEFFEAPELP